MEMFVTYGYLVDFLKTFQVSVRSFVYEVNCTILCGAYLRVDC